MEIGRGGERKTKKREMKMLGSAQALANHTIRHSYWAKEKKLRKPFNVVFYVEQKIDH